MKSDDLTVAMQHNSVSPFAVLLPLSLWVLLRRGLHSPQLLPYLQISNYFKSIIVISFQTKVFWSCIHHIIAVDTLCEILRKEFSFHSFGESLNIVIAEKFNNQRFATVATVCALFSHAVPCICRHSMVPSVIIYAVLNINLCNILLILTSS